jgi:uncharacterized protein (DUF433 family)
MDKNPEQWRMGTPKESSDPNVLEYLREGIPFETIIEDYYPDLQMEDVRSCVHYAIGRGISK